VLSANTWYAIEVETNATASGHGEVWLNGTSIGSFNGDLSQAQSYGKLVLDNEATGTVYFDDVAIANAYTIPTNLTEAQLTPTSLSFGSQIVNTTSGAQTVTVLNNGTAALDLSGIAITGPNASDFAQTNNCPTSLAVNASCTINVTFTPTASGSRSASVTLTENTDVRTISLSGTGATTAPAVSLSPTSLNLGSQTVGTSGSAQVITLTNSGMAALTISGLAISGTNASEFAQTNNCPASLPVGSSCAINVTFTPTASGTRSASLTITDNAADSPQTVALSGTGSQGGQSAYFSDGFEGGNLSQWSNGSSGTGAATVQTSVVNSGTHAVQLSNTSGQLIQISTSVSGLPTLSYTRFYFRFASLSGTTLIALGQDASGHNQWIIYYDSGRKGLDVYFWNASGTRYDVYSNTNVLSANTWYAIEVETNATASGHGEVWLNGTSIGSFDGNLSQTQSYGKLVLDNEATGTIYFDDVAITGTYNGPLALRSGPSSPLQANWTGQGLAYMDRRLQ
jgi:hypothetical protein